MPEKSSVQVIDPKTRKFSQFKTAIDNHIDELKGKKILMYCTGGVRCERASSYLKAKGLESVYQLHGGIHAYQEKFPTGGYFRGKNFVYDPRRALPYPQLDETIGSCFLCMAPYDDYSSESRCAHCRMLVLLCASCRQDGNAASVLCEQCQVRSSDEA